VQLDKVPRRLLLVVGLIMLGVLAVPAVLVVPAGVAQVVDPTTTTIPATTTTTIPPTTTTMPPPSTTTPTTPTTTTPGSSTTSPATTTTLPDPAKLPSNPFGEGIGLSPDQLRATQSAFAALSGSERALLRDLENAKDVLANRQFALVALLHEVSAVRDQLDAARHRATAAVAQAKQTAARIRHVKHEIVGLAVSVYRARPATASLMAFDTTAVTDLARAEAYARSDANVLDARVVELETLTHRLDAERTSAERARAEAEDDAKTLKSRLDAQEQAVKEASAAATASQAAVTRAISSGASLLAQVASPHFGADNIAATLAVSQAGQPEPTQLVGIFELPIPGAPLASPYGMRIDPLSGAGGFHPGVDFEASSGTPIHAAAAGVVVIAGDCGGYGNCVVIDHGTQLATVYGHQSALVAQVGDHVNAGEVIGLVGSTGLSTGPHLHFEVRLRGITIDPVSTLGA
jgi:murein DD-endopeptidase MepM/ murein hydrolase activator NlpD